MRKATTSSIIILCAVTLGLATQQASADSVNLGTADNFAILGGQSVTFTAPSSTVTGDVGVSPGTSITGAGVGENLTLTGTSTINNGGAAQAQSDSAAAYVVAKGEAPTGTIANQLGGQTLLPGIYNFGLGTTVNLTGVLTLNAQNAPGALFIFQVPSDLITAAGSLVNLINGADDCNVVWQVTSSATLGATSSFDGTVLASTSITVGSGVNVDGRLLAQTGDVTLINDTITSEPCQPGMDSGGSGGSDTRVPDSGRSILLLGFGLVCLIGFKGISGQTMVRARC